MEKVVSTGTIALAIVISAIIISLSVIRIAEIQKEQTLELEELKQKHGLERDAKWLAGEAYSEPVDYEANREELLNNQN